METVIANDGTMLPLAALETTFTYDGALIETIQVKYTAASTGVLSYFTQTYTNDGSRIIEISQWTLGAPV